MRMVRPHGRALAAVILLPLCAPLSAPLRAVPMQRAAMLRAPRHLAPASHGLGAHAHDHHDGQVLSVRESIASFISDTQEMWLAFRRHALNPRFELKRASFEDSSSKGSMITVVGALVNLLLSVFKALAGVYGHSTAMLCDAAHSLSDLVSDALTLLALRMGSLPPDHDHPYGHGRFEALGSLAIGWLLVLTAASFGQGALASVVNPPTSPPGRIALVAAVVSVASKELLFRSTERVGKKLNSQASALLLFWWWWSSSSSPPPPPPSSVSTKLHLQVIMANAWHHRSDALSSLVAIGGIGGALLGVRILDPLCGVVVAGAWAQRHHVAPADFRALLAWLAQVSSAGWACRS